jgi:hypothetical protein
MVLARSADRHKANLSLCTAGAPYNRVTLGVVAAKGTTLHTERVALRCA